MPINPQQYFKDEAWLLFQLNTVPVVITSHGNFNMLAILDVATGLVYGMELINVDALEPSEFEARRLLSSSESKAGVRPKLLFVDSALSLAQLTKAVTAMGVKVVREEGQYLDQFTEEPRESFAAYAARGWQ